MRRWDFHADMTGDGFVTISDVGEWLGWLFLFPGDCIIWFIMDWKPQLAGFFEMSEASYGNWFSIVMSLIAWGALINILIPNDNKPRHDVSNAADPGR